MKMDGDIRVRTDRRHRMLYNDLKNFTVGDMHELFFLCTCLGYKAEKMKPLSNNGEDRFYSRTFTTDEWACFYAIMIETKNMDFNAILDDKMVISAMESYANAGMQILLDEILDAYVINDASGPKLDAKKNNELPKIMLSFIYEQLTERDKEDS